MRLNAVCIPQKKAENTAAVFTLAYVQLAHELVGFTSDVTSLIAALIPFDKTSH